MFNFLNDPEQETIVPAEILQKSLSTWIVLISEELNHEETEEIIEEMTFSFHNFGLSEFEVYSEITI